MPEAYMLLSQNLDIKVINFGIIDGWHHKDNFGDDVMFAEIKETFFKRGQIAIRPDFFSSRASGLKLKRGFVIKLIYKFLKVLDLLMIMISSKYIIGGGNLFDSDQSCIVRSRRVKYFHLFNSSKPLIVYGVSFNKKIGCSGVNSVKKLIHQATSITVRDINSIKLLSSLSPTNVNKYKFSRDIVYDYLNRKEILLNVSQNTHDRDDTLIGISAVGLPTHFNASHYVPLIKSILEKNSTGKRVKFRGLVFCSSGTFSEKDLLVSIFKMLNVEYDLAIYNGKIDLFINQFRECSFVIATRLHSQVLADNFDIPWHGIVYHSKSFNVLESYSENEIPDMTQIELKKT
jgi:polysaccharide pyruvyl transferase WcaK-like protein